MTDKRDANKKAEHGKRLEQRNRKCTENDENDETRETVGIWWRETESVKRRNALATDFHNDGNCAP